MLRVLVHFEVRQSGNYHSLDVPIVPEWYIHRGLLSYVDWLCFRVEWLRRVK